MSLYHQRVRTHPVLVFYLLLLLTQSVFASGSGILKGKVFDRDTRDELPGATVIIKGTNIGAATDINGSYTIYNAPAGSQTVTVSYVGYITYSAQVTILQDSQNPMDFYLTAQALTAKNVLVTAQAQGQMQSINQQLSANQIVSVVSAEKMKELPDANIAESIGRLPGISLQRSAGEAYAVVVRI
jgi:CarboxypepD_reg-like domain